MIYKGKEIQFSKKLAEYLTKKDYFNRDFAQLAEINETQVSKWRGGAGISPSTIDKIGEKVPEFIDFLLNDKQFGKEKDESSENFTYESETKDPRDRLPIYDITAKAGIPYLVNTLDDVQIIDYFSIPGFRDCIGFVQVAGDSMSGFVEDGEYIAIKPASFDGIFWGSAYFIVFGGDIAQEPLIKYIREGEDGGLILRSHNYQNYPDMKVSKTKILSIFTVKGIAKIKRVR